MGKPIYFDNAASTLCDQRVVEAMLPYFTDFYGNASNEKSQTGAFLKKKVSESRNRIAYYFDCLPQNIIWTSGATESNNLVLSSFNHSHPKFISTAIEHKSVLEPLNYYRRKGANVIQIRPNGDGVISFSDLLSKDLDNTNLVSVILVNNEIGVVNDVKFLAKLCRESGVYLHVDASQAIGKLRLNFRDLDVDFLTFSAHKIHGPKGTGVLLARDKSVLVPQMIGGGQEENLRSGTLNVPGIIGTAKAIELLGSENDIAHIETLRDTFEQRLRDSQLPLTINGRNAVRAAHISSVTFDIPHFNTFLEEVSKSIIFSTGSACDTPRNEPSHVLTALGIGSKLAKQTLRFSFGRFNTMEEIIRSTKIIINAANFG